MTRQIGIRYWKEESKFIVVLLSSKKECSEKEIKSDLFLSSFMFLNCSDECAAKIEFRNGRGSAYKVTSEYLDYESVDRGTVEYIQDNYLDFSILNEKNQFVLLTEVDVNAEYSEFD